MENDEEIIFTSDCVINLDDLPPLEDYVDLLLTLTREAPTRLTPSTIKRLNDADI